MHYDVRTLYDGTEFRFKLHLQDSSGVRRNDAPRQLELARLVAISAAAREPLARYTFRSQRNEVRAIHADTNSAVASLRRSLNAPLKEVNGALHGQEVRLGRAVEHGTVDTAATKLRQVVVVASCGLEQLKDL